MGVEAAREQYGLHYLYEMNQGNRSLESIKTLVKFCKMPAARS